MEYTEVSVVGTGKPDKGDGRITIASTPEIEGKRGIDVETLDTSQYLRNPIVLWTHDRRQLPIAKTINLEKRDGKLIADFKFNTDDPFAARVKKAWDNGFLNGASIGWDGNTNALKEWSFVPVPADPDAIRAPFQRMIDDFVTVEDEPMAEQTETREAAPAEATERAAPSIDVDALVLKVSESVMAKLEERDASVRTAQEESVSREQEIAELANERAALIVTATPLLPKEFSVSESTNRQIMLKALGLGEDTQRSDDYLRGVLDAQSAQRSQAQEQRFEMLSSPPAQNAVGELSLSELREAERNDMLRTLTWEGQREAIDKELGI